MFLPWSFEKHYTHPDLNFVLPPHFLLFCTLFSSKREGKRGTQQCTQHRNVEHSGDASLSPTESDDSNSRKISWSRAHVGHSKNLTLALIRALSSSHSFTLSLSCTQFLLEARSLISFTRNKTQSIIVLARSLVDVTFCGWRLDSLGASNRKHKRDQNLTTTTTSSLSSNYIKLNDYINDNVG